MTQKINPCLWFDHNAEEAAKFHTSLFKDSKIGRIAKFTKGGAQVSGQKENSTMTIEYEMASLKLIGINGGPMFKFTPSFSFFVWCDTESEIDSLWKSLSNGGEARMVLDKYPWAEKYGWTSDKYGVEWQLMLKEGLQKITPTFLFVDELFGKGEEAISFYAGIFKNSKIDALAKDEETKIILHCQFELEGQCFVLMEGQGKHGHKFNNSFSLVVNCDSQDEIDYYWNKLSQGGEIEQCGWLKDKFGVSWQVVPTVLSEIMSGKNKQKSERAMGAILQMKKIEIDKIMEA